MSRYAIYGAGSLGTVLGAYITKNGGQIDLINRNRAHVAALREKGARITGTVEMTVPVTAYTPDEMSDFMNKKCGFLGVSGSQTSALLVIADEYPEVPEPTLSAIVIEEKLHVMGVGDTAEVAPILIHPSCTAEITYTSSDEAVATVDGDGVITAVAPGTAEITVKKAAAILGNSESAARNTLRSLVKKGYLTEDMSKVPFIYSLEQHLPL